MAAHKPRSGLSDAFKALRGRESSGLISVPRAVPDSTRRLTPPAASKRNLTSNG